MKYISRLTALLLAFILFLPTVADAQLTVDDLTKSSLDALYQAADPSTGSLLMPPGVLGDTITLSAFENAFFKNFHWYDSLGYEVASGSNTLEVSYKLVDQEFYCVNFGLVSGFWDQTSDSFFVPQAQTSDLDAYLDFIFTADYMDASGYPDRSKVFDFVTANWDIILADGSNLAENIIAKWMNEPVHVR